MVSFLEKMRNYPVLWEFHDKPFNEDYRIATEELCQTINTQWSLNIDQLSLRRSINRVLRFYRYLYPSETIAKFAEYFDICGVFLPSAVIKIPHARCSHCFKCCTGDYELKKHILQEHKSLNWHYRCNYCAESFRSISEYDFHKRLPHFVEMFTCEQCNRRFYIAHAYSKHMKSHQLNTQKTKAIKITSEIKQNEVNTSKETRKNAEERKTESNEIKRNHICEVCAKGFNTIYELTSHQVYHGKKKHKCHLCPKSYFKNYYLKLHLKSHRNQKDFICEICAAKFISAPFLKRHLETHYGNQITCNICGLKLSKRSMYRHLRTIHIAYEGTLEETFRAKNHRFRLRDPLKVRKYTKPREYRKPRECTKPRAPEKFPRQYNCKICNIEFERLKFLKDHNQECHTNGIPKTNCKICNVGISPTNLKRHYKEKHKLINSQILALEVKGEDV